ncbi:MAG: carboxypeptidase regulatory-like domain-containing protein [Pyrinomonadaceae bacterium]
MDFLRLRNQRIRELISFGLTLVFMTSWLAFPAYPTNPKRPRATEHHDPLKSPAVATRPEAAKRSDAAADARSSKPKQTEQERAAEAYGKLPLSFEANQGQTDARVKYITRGRNYGLYLTQDEAVMVLGSSAAPAGPQSSSARQAPAAKKAADTVVRMKYVRANPQAQVTGSGELPTRSNYFKGNNPRQWQTDVPHYSKVKYEGIYPGVDLIYYGNDNRLEYDFVVAPGANPSDIRLGFEGVSKLSINRSGDLILETGAGVLRQKKPFIYQEVDGARKEIEGRYVRAGKHQVGFAVGEYDRKKPLIIDPVLIYSTYLGGGGSDVGNSIAIDSAGNAYIAGRTTSLNFPLTGGTQPSNGGSADIFITKLNPTGTSLVYSTYMGGSGTDAALGIVLDGSANAYLTGTTESADFPTVNALQSAYGGNRDGFVAKLNSTGNVLNYSTYLGGSANDESNGIAIDSTGSAYLTGGTSSVDFTVVNPVQATNWASVWMSNGSPDVFVTKLDASGTSIVYSTFLGGLTGDEGKAIAVDSSKQAYVTGVTSSKEFPIANALQSTLGGTSNATDAFVTKLSETGTALVYSTYLGGSGYDGANGIAVDSAGNAHVVGYAANNFPVVAGSYRTTFRGGGSDGFAAKLDPAGLNLIYSTYLGGGGQDQAKAVALDSAGNAYVVGYAGSTSYPAAGGSISATPISNGIWHAKPFISKLDAPGKLLPYSTFLGSHGSTFMQSDFINGVAVDASGDAYVTGSTAGRDFPTTQGAFQTTYDNSDVYLNQAFVSKVSAANGLSISGRLTDNTGSILTNAPVSLSGSQTRLCVTNDNGDYWFGGLPSGGNYTVTPSGAKYLFAPLSQTFTNMTANQTLNFSGTLKTYTISGRVTDAAGAGVSAVDILVNGSPDAQTNATGNYSVTVNAGSDYTVTPSKDGQVFSPADQTFTDLSANQTANFTVGYSISGQLLDTTGSGISDYSTVTLSGSTSRTAQADYFGNYSFDNLARGGNYTVTPSSTFYGFTPATRTFNNLSADQTADFTGLTYKISGHVMDPSGASLPGLGITLSGSHTGSGYTDANGNYSINVAPGGTYTVAQNPGLNYTFAPASYTFANVSADQTANFTATTYLIHGRVYDNYGWPLMNAKVTISGSRSANIFTDFTGTYGFYVAPGGTYTVTPSYDYYSGFLFVPDSTTFTNLSGNQTLNFQVGSKRISGRVTDKHGRDILYGVIYVTGTQTGTTNIHDGVYTVFVQTGGTYTITPGTGGVLTPASRTFTNVTSDQTGDFSESFNVSITGRVSNANRIGTGGVTMTLSGADNATTQTDASGNYTFSGLAEGASYWVSASKPGYTFTPASQSYNSTDEGDAPLDFTALKTGRYALNPTADAYVAEAMPTTSQGTSPEMRVLKSSTPGTQNESLLTFDLAGIPGNVTSARLRLYGKLSATGSVPITVYPVSTTTWVDSGTQAVTWNTKPTASATGLNSFTPSSDTYGWYEVDLLSYVSAERSAGRNVVSLALKGTSTTSPYAVFNSREATENRPELLVTSVPNINSLTPATGPIGTTVTIKGVNFGTQQRDSTVTFNGISAAPTSWSDSTIVVAVPAGAGTGPVIVTVDEVASNPATYTITSNGTINGTITRSSDGAAVNGAKVEAMQDGLVKATVTANASGAYTIAGLPAGAYDLRISATGYATTLRTANQVVAGSATSVNVALASEGIISGKVTRSDNAAAISGALVKVYQGTTVIGTATTNATGDYSVKALPAGSYSADASASGFPPKSQTGINVTAGATTTVNISLNVLTATYHLHNEASLINPAFAQLKTAGPDVAAATLLSAELKSQANGEKVVKEFETQANVPNASGVIPTGSTLSFSLWMRKTVNIGTMFPRAKVFINNSSGAALCTATGTTALTTTVAKYTVTCATTAPVTMTSSSRFYLWTGVNLTAGSTTTAFKADLRIEGVANGNYDSLVTLPLPTPAPSISGLSPASGPVGTVVTVTGANFGATQGTGTITFNGVTASPSSWNNTSIAVPVPTGALTGPVVVTTGGQASNTQTFTVTNPGTISGSIKRSSDNAAISGATVSVLQFNVVKRTVTSAADGTYSVTGLAPGAYDLRVTAATYGTALRTGNTVTSGGTSVQNFTLSTAGTIAGKISKPDGTGISGASVIALLSGTTIGSATTNATGDYSITGLGAGSYTVEASASGYGAKSQSGVAVTAGATTTLNLTLNPPAVDYHLHTEASSTSGLSQLKTNGPDVASAVLLTAELNGQATGEKLIKEFDTQANVPNASGVIPTGSTLSFSLWMRKTAAVGTMFPRAKVFINNSSGAALCTATGTTALTTTVAKYTVTCATTAPVTMTSSSRFYLWTGVNLTAAASSAFKGELSIEGTLGGNYDSLVTLPLPPVKAAISGVSPSAGAVGTVVTVTGTNFGATQGTGTITFNGVTASPLSWSASSIVVPVPMGALTGPVVVTTGGLASDGFAFIVDGSPYITALLPAFGPVGTSVTIDGLNFGTSQGSSTIKFNGVGASASSWGVNRLIVTVPSGITTGPVKVAVGGLDSNGFVFTLTTNNPATDTDGDGMADSWETQYFGNLNQTATGDFDGDGVNNLTEFQRGRNPTKGEVSDTGGAVNLKVYTTLEP